MAEFYLDVSALGNEYQAYADVPTSWAVPQDGNGKAGPGHAAAVPVCEVTFAAVPTSGAISVYGANITLTGVLSAASTSAAATALASSINASTAALAAGVSALLLPINRFVYARVKPGASSTVQIMSRFAGSDLNYPANTAARVVNTFNNTAMTSPVDFTGGADGPWAYIMNLATVFGKTTLGSGYGLYFAAAPTPTNPTSNDLVHVRTGRGGSGLAVPFAASVTFTPYWVARSYLYDDGTVWNDGGSNGTLTVDILNSSGSSVQCYGFAPVGGLISHVGAADDKLVLRCGNTLSGSGSMWAFADSNGGQVAFVRCTFEQHPSHNNSFGANALALVCNGGTSHIKTFADLSDSKSIFRGYARRVILNQASGAGADGGNTGVRHKMNGHRVTVLAATGAIGPVVAYEGAATFADLEWIGGEIKDSNGVYRCPNPVSANANSRLTALIDGVIGVTDPSIGFTATAEKAGSLVWNQPEGPNKGYRLETPQFTVDWKNDGTFPYVGAAADLRGVNWSHRVTWNNTPSRSTSMTPMTLRRFYRAASAVRTVTLDLYVPTATTFYTDEIELAVSYLDSGDVWRTERTSGVRARQGSASRTALTASSASWTPNGVPDFAAKKLELTTQYPVKQNSEVIARLTLCAPRSPSLVFYASPELGIA